MKRKVWYLGLFFLITCSLLLVAVGCGFSQDFSQTPAYSALFSDQDSDTQKTLKNLVIKQIEAYNAQDPEAYASHSSAEMKALSRSRLEAQPLIRPWELY